MISGTRPVLAAAFIVGVFFLGGVYNVRGVVDAQQQAPLQATRMYTGADGQSHVEKVSVKLSAVHGNAITVEQSEPVKVSSSYVVRVAPGVAEDWHNADARRYVIPISGKAEVEVANGEKFSVEPGGIYIAEDLTGKGHKFRVVGDEEWVALFVNFAQ
jgi:hypothetical protein